MVSASRPHMPGYGVLPADQGTGLLPWSWATDKLAASHDYWLATVWPDGRPHVTPVWGVWLDGAIWFSCGATSRKAHNLRAEPRCSVTIDDARDPVVVEGVAQCRGDEAGRRRFLGVLNEKYDVAYDLDFLDGVTALCLQIQPVRAFGLVQSDFSGSPTRWTLPS